MEFRNSHSSGPLLADFRKVLESDSGLTFLPVGSTHAIDGSIRVDPEHKDGGAEDWAVIIKDGAVKHGVPGYRVSGQSPRFATDIWFIMHILKSYVSITYQSQLFSKVSVLIEHDHLHIVRDEIGGVWVQIGHNGDPTPFSAAFKATAFQDFLTAREFKKVKRS